MDNREKAAPAQSGSSRAYAIDELLSLMEPQYRAYRNTMRQCIAGLTEYAAQLTAQGLESQIPTFRRMIVEMVEFWGLAEDDTPKGFREITDQYGGAFDQAVSAASSSDSVPELSEQTKRNILTGLDLYAQEMTDCGDLDQWISECSTLASRLRAEWQMEMASCPQTMQMMEDMHL